MKQIVIVFVTALGLATVAQAEPCKLTLETRLDMRPDDGGHAVIPLSVDGQPVNFVLDTGAVFSSITSDAADKLGLPRKQQKHSSEIVYGGALVTQYVTAETLDVGTRRAYRFNLPVLPKGVMPGDDGIIGSDIFAANDVDFDFANSKFSIFSQSHCPGGVVYWTQTGFAQVPMRFDDDHHIQLDVSVDGKPTLAALDTGAPVSTMSLDYAESVLGVDPKSPDLKPMPTEDSGRHYYRYPFKTLSLNGLTINNPNIVLIADDESRLLGGGAHPEMLIGMSILSKLHLYVAYGEHNLYITPADAH